MAKNLIHYEGRIVNKDGKAKLEKSRNGKGRVQIVLAEGFQERNDRAPEKFRKPELAADAWVNTYTKWHRLDIWGSLDEGSALLALVTDPDFNHGAILEVNASYKSEEYVRRRDNVEVQNDREAIFLDGEQKDDGFDTSIQIKISQKGNLLGASEGYARAIYSGGPIDDLGSGGGRPPAPEYGDDEGF
jgi:hypothetical protein